MTVPPVMPSEFLTVFDRLRALLRRNAGTFVVTEDSEGLFRISGRPGPATLRAWGGEIRSEHVPVAWAQVGNTYVSAHLLGLYGDREALTEMSPRLQMRLRGKTCFNFKKGDEELVGELEPLIVHSIERFRRGGFAE